MIFKKHFFENRNWKINVRSKSYLVLVLNIMAFLSRLAKVFIDKYFIDNNNLINFNPFTGNIESTQRREIVK